MRRYQVLLIAFTAVVLAGIAAYILYGDALTNGRGIAQVGGPFTLTDQYGRTRTDADFRGQYMFVYFGYTFCPDVCPTELSAMTQAMDMLPAATQKKITPIFITIDPQRDTVKQMKAYVANFHPRMVGLTGTPEQIARVAKEYRVYYAKDKNNGETSDYLMDHSSIIFLMDPEGHYVTHFTPNTTPETIAKILGKNVSG